MSDLTPQQVSQRFVAVAERATRLREALDRAYSEALEGTEESIAEKLCTVACILMAARLEDDNREQDI